ncbi:uncharacterized protein TNCV_4781191 [Trichonephila clavipes]|nr:uncharacterized protein TNCV_4781191 [Trichonephila clavipes]
MNTGAGYFSGPPHAYTMGVKYRTGWVSTSGTVGSNLKSETRTRAKILAKKLIDEENKQKEETLREFELQKIRLQNEAQRVVGPQTLPQTKIELKKLLPTFNPEVDNMDLFLTLFERQMKLLDLGEDLWVPYLIGALPSDVTFLIAREPEEKYRDYTPTFEECFCNDSN